MWPSFSSKMNHVFNSFDQLTRQASWPSLITFYDPKSSPWASLGELKSFENVFKSEIQKYYKVNKESNLNTTYNPQVIHYENIIVNIY
jgi:hypothetical protein